MENSVKVERIRPKFLLNKPHFANLVTSEGGKIIHLSGLVASTKDGDLVGAGDLAAQMAYIDKTIRRSLALAGAVPANVARQRVFVVGLKLEHRPIIMQAMMDFYGDSGSASSTCVSVEALLVDGALVESDTTAVVDGT